MPVVVFAVYDQEGHQELVDEEPPGVHCPPPPGFFRGSFRGRAGARDSPDAPLAGGAPGEGLEPTPYYTFMYVPSPSVFLRRTF